MWSIDLESRILELAEARGLLDAGASEALGDRDWLSPEALEEASAWGPRLDHLLSRGSLAEEQVQSLAWEALHAPSPEPAVPTPASVEAPALASRFQDLALLGEGATARVYRAFDTRLQRPVALKRLKSIHGHQLQRLLAEAKAQARVDHPFVCKVYDVWEAEGEALIVLQLAEGGTLARSAPLRPREAAAFVRDAALGAHAAHVQGLVHLDLKPGNLLLWRDDRGELRPLLSDFGLGRPEGLRGRGVPMGTPPYSSPEQVRGDLVDRRSDVHALGMVLYVLLAGRFPFEAASFPDLVEALQRHPPLPLRALRPDLPADLEAILSACLARDPRDRYPTAQALAEDLDRYLAGLPVAVAEKAWGYRLAKALRRHRALAWTLGAAGLAIAASLGWGAWNLKFQADQTRWAAHFDQDLHAWETQFNYVYALPAHDITPDMNRLDAAYEELKARVEHGNRAMRGPGHYALARMAKMLYWDERVGFHLDEAVKAGYRTPQVELARAELMMTNASEVISNYTTQAAKDNVNQFYLEPIKSIIKSLQGQIFNNEKIRLDILNLILQNKYGDAIKMGKNYYLKHPWDLELAVKLCDLYQKQILNAMSNGTTSNIRMNQILTGQTNVKNNNFDKLVISNCQQAKSITDDIISKYPCSPACYHAIMQTFNTLAVIKINNEQFQKTSIKNYKQAIQYGMRIWTNDPELLKHRAIVLRAVDVPTIWAHGEDPSSQLLELDNIIAANMTNKYQSRTNKLRYKQMLIHDKANIISTFGINPLINVWSNFIKPLNTNNKLIPLLSDYHTLRVSTIYSLQQKIHVELEFGIDARNSIDEFMGFVKNDIDCEFVPASLLYPRILFVYLDKIENYSMNPNDQEEIAKNLRTWEKGAPEEELPRWIVRARLRRFQLHTSSKPVFNNAPLAEAVSRLEALGEKTDISAVFRHQLLLEKGCDLMELASWDSEPTSRLNEAIAAFLEVRKLHPWSTEAAEFLGEACRLRALCGAPDRRLLLEGHDWAQKALEYVKPLSDAEIKAGKRRPFPPWRLEWPHQGRSLLVRGHVELDLARTAPHPPERLRWARAAQASLEASLRFNKNLSPKLQPLLEQARALASDAHS